MAPQRPSFYVVDDAGNFLSTNAKTQKDVLYYERDTGRYKLGKGNRWNETPYYSPGVDIRLDQEITKFIEDQITKCTFNLLFEPRIEQKRTAFNVDFGDTKETVARGKHHHDVSEIDNLNIPERVPYPEVPNGYVLHDNKSFKPIIVDDKPKSHSNLPISSSWAYEHIKSNTHLTPDQVSSIHQPVTVEGPGIQVSNQVISLKCGTTKNDISIGNHTHREYAREEHIHSDVISPDRLPAASRDKRGSVPPTGSPTNKFLQDSGNWAYPDSICIIPLSKELPFWVAPKDCELSFASIGSTSMSATDISVNGTIVTRLSSSKTKVQGYFSNTQDIAVALKAGDVVETIIPNISYVHLGIIINR